MASILIRNVDQGLKERLRVQAAQHGKSMEAEAREILAAGVKAAPAHELNFYQAIRRHFEPFGGFELELPPREPIREPPTFEDWPGE